MVIGLIIVVASGLYIEAARKYEMRRQRRWISPYAAHPTWVELLGVALICVGMAMMGD